MRDLADPEVDQYRVRGNKSHGWDGDGTCGAFAIPLGSFSLAVIASSGEGWDHISVSLPNRIPNWHEMARIKDMFFQRHEWAMQLHAPPDDHINCHPYTLHLWRSQDVPIPIPPKWMV